MSRTIAGAVEQQTATTREIAQSIASTAQGAEVVSIGVAESASAAKEITENITTVDQVSKRTTSAASQTAAPARNLRNSRRTSTPSWGSSSYEPPHGGGLPVTRAASARPVRAEWRSRRAASPILRRTPTQR